MPVDVIGSRKILASSHDAANMNDHLLDKYCILGRYPGLKRCIHLRLVLHWNTMVQSAYINLAGLILFSISAATGFILFLVGHKSSTGGRGKVNYD